MKPPKLDDVSPSDLLALLVSLVSLIMSLSLTLHISFNETYEFNGRYRHERSNKLYQHHEGR